MAVHRLVAACPPVQQGAHTYHVACQFVGPPTRNCHDRFGPFADLVSLPVDRLGPKVADEADSEITVAVRNCAPHRGTEIEPKHVELSERPHRRVSIRHADHCHQRGDPHRGPLAVGAADGGIFASAGKAFPREGSHRFQQTVMGAVLAAFGDHERVVHQGRDCVDDVELVQRFIAGDDDNRVEVNGPRKHPHAIEHHLRRLVQQLIGPLDGRLQGAMAGVGASWCSKQPEPIIEAGQQIGWAHATHPCRRQFYRQRHPIEPLTQRLDGGAALAGCEAGVGRDGAIVEKGYA